VPASAHPGTVRVGQLVTGVPERGDVGWVVVFSEGSPPVLEVGAVDDADVALVESYESARALAAGARTAAGLLEAGELKIRGAAPLLVALSADLEAVAAAVGGLRAATSWS
jgi:hypothetical protein